MSIRIMKRIGCLLGALAVGIPMMIPCAAEEPESTDATLTETAEAAEVQNEEQSEDAEAELLEEPKLNVFATCSISGNKLIVHADFSGRLINQYVGVALYDAENRMYEFFTVPQMFGQNCVDVVFYDDGIAAWAKVFVLADEKSLSPVSEVAEAIVVRDIGTPVRLKYSKENEIFLTTDENGEFLRYDEEGNLWAYAGINGRLQWIPLAPMYYYPTLSVKNEEAYTNLLGYYSVDENGLYKLYYEEIEPITIQTERLLGRGTDAATWVLETRTGYPKDVIEAQYQVVATPHYARRGYEETLDFGYNAVYFACDDESYDYNPSLPKYFYWDFDTLGLPGTADDYFMGNIKFIMTYDSYREEIEHIYAAEPMMTKKTVSNIRFMEVTGNTKKSYMVEGDTDSAKVLSGEILVDGKPAYFYDAPYSYLRPTYWSSDRETQYLQRNEDNLKIIERDVIDAENEIYTYNTYSVIIPCDLIATTFPDASEELMNRFLQAYVGGLYEATFYDVDGDNRYEYIEYMPYEFAFVDTSDKHSFAREGIRYNGDAPTVYTNGAVIDLPDGVSALNDGDFVIGYFDENCNYIKVSAVVEPIVGKVTKINKAARSVTFSNGVTANVNKGWRLVENYNNAYSLDDYNYSLDNVDDAFNEFTNLLSAAIYGADEAKYYVCNGTVLFVEDIRDENTSNRGIVVLTEDKNGEWFGQYINKETGTLEYDAYAWIGDELRWIPVETDTDVTDVFPKIGTASHDIYVDRVSQYTVDGNGVYTIIPLDGAFDEDGESYELPKDIEAVLIEKDDEEFQAYGEYSFASMTKSFSKRFILDDGINDPFTVTLTADTRIMIKNYNSVDDKYEYVTFDYTSLTDSFDGMLKNVQYVIGADTEYTNRAKLILLYAEGVDLDLDFGGTPSPERSVGSAHDLRIVRSSAPFMNSDNSFCYLYEVMDPYTGNVVQDVSGTLKKNTASALESCSPLAPGTVIRIGSDGTVDDTSTNRIVGVLDTVSNEGLAYMIGFDKDEKIMEIDILDKTAEEHFTVHDEFFSAIHVDDKTTFAVLKYEKNNKIGTAEVKPVSYEEFANGGRELKAYNNKIESETYPVKYETKYAENVKAFITYSMIPDYEYPVADTVLIIVNPDEHMELLDLD